MFAYLPSELNLRFGYFYMWIFFIRGCCELCVVDFDEFSLFFLLIDVVLKFYQGISKN